ncbi:SDR family NAD(P)-dependent oxidoreductase [Rhizobium halophytocola]|nr:SDR family NAD(P)-dependent oxidoreductase [Rhizobium halophytocola]
MSSLASPYTALVIGASGGIGAAFCERIEGDDACGRLLTLSRSMDGFDLCDEESVARAAGRIRGAVEHVDLLICATGALTIDGVGPEKTIRAIDQEAMRAQFDLNAIGPALVLKHFAGLLPRDRRAAIAFLSARVGSIGDNRLGGWISYRASKAALNQIVRTAAIEIGRSRPKALVIALHPGTVATGLSADYGAGHDRFSAPESAGKLLDVIDQRPASDSGAFLAYDGSRVDW